MLTIFRFINIFQKDLNLTCYVMYSYKINILASTWDHWIKKFSNIHAIIEKKILTCFY